MGIVAVGHDEIIELICVNAGDLAAIGSGSACRMGEDGWWNGARG